MELSKIKNNIESVFGFLSSDVDSAECFYTEVKKSSFSIKMQKVESKNSSNTRGLGLRLIKGGRLGHAYTTDFSDNGLKTLVKNAMLNCKYQEKAYPLTFQTCKREDWESNLDEEINNVSFNEKFAMLAELEEKIKKGNKNISRIERSSYAQINYASYLANSNQYSSYSEGNLASISTMLLSQSGEQEESGGSGLSVRKFSNFCLDKVAEEAIFDAKKLLGAQKLKGYRGMAVFSKDMAVTLLSLIAQSFKGDSVYKKKSLFPILGESCAPSFFNITDDATLKSGFSSYKVDSEGEFGQRTSLIKNGVVAGHLYDRYYANLTNNTSTGNGLRDGYSDIPYVGYSNLFIENGNNTLERLFQLMDKGIYITDILGAHTANPITGDFSFGISGIEIREGHFATPFRGATISGNLKNLLKNIVALGNDNDYRESLSAPSLLIDGLSIAG